LIEGFENPKPTPFFRFAGGWMLELRLWGVA
jgi:hypothetical protein